MKNNISCFAVSLLALVVAGDAFAMCTPPGDPPGGIEFDTCVDASDAATTWRYVAINNIPQACPTAAGWSSAKLFDGGGEIPPGLDDYCIFNASSENASVAQLNALLCSGDSPPTNCLLELAADLLAVTYQSVQTVEGLVVDDFEGKLMSSTGAPNPLPAGPQRVRLGVLDTEPNGPNQDRNGPGVALHGFSLLNFARKLICPDSGACGVALNSTLTLPLQLCSTDPGATCQCSMVPESGVCLDPAVGGYLGPITALARAAYDEVTSWEGSGVNRLVINLSVGWEPRFGGQPPLATTDLPARAVAKALEYASCRGALVIAAAGNRAPGPDLLTGPLYPGGWETEDAPGLQQCVALLGGQPDPTMFPVPMGTYRPLVYAVSAVDHEAGKIETRQAGEARLVAFGDHAIVRTDIGGNNETTAALSGSSSAALVVSAATAAAWYQRPAVPGYAIMETLYSAAQASGRSAEFCNDDGSGCAGVDVRRVRVCETINAVCGAFPGAVCPNYDCPIDVPVIAPLPVNDLLGAFAADVMTDITSLASSAAVPECGAGYILHWTSGPTVPAVPCPHRQYYGLQVTPWTDGQPSGQACELCLNGYSSPGKMFIEVVAEFEEDLEDLTLLCGNNAYRLPGQMQPGERRLVTGIPESCKPETLALAARVTRGSGASASVLSASLQRSDRDDDGVQDAEDNCYEVPNPLQIDSNGDDIGNVCDADYNDDCIANVIDLGFLRNNFFTPNPHADHNGDGIVNVLDLATLKTLFFAVPGPSGIPNVCSP